jgi:hypothetical protein
MLDMYAGHVWAEALLTETTRTVLTGRSDRYRWRPS